MTNIDIANGMIFQALNLQKGNFSQRLLCQKKIFLLQQAGVNLGYDYNWYVHGPYSPRLTSYIYDNLDVLSSMDFAQHTLKSDVANKIEEINSFSASTPVGIGVDAWYELLASVLYIYKNKKSWKLNSFEDVRKKLIEEKPKYTVGECDLAHTALQSTACWPKAGD